MAVPDGAYLRLELELGDEAEHVSFALRAKGGGVCYTPQLRWIGMAGGGSGLGASAHSPRAAHGVGALGDALQCAVDRV